MTFTSLNVAAITVLGLLGVGLYGLLVVRNLLKVIVGLQILVKGVILALVAAGAAAGEVNLGQSLAITVIVADTIVAVVALALAIQVKRRLGSLDIRTLSSLRG
jgi:NADH-quinone oxidoreductase subunit K